MEIGASFQNEKACRCSGPAYGFITVRTAAPPTDSATLTVRAAGRSGDDAMMQSPRVPETVLDCPASAMARGNIMNI